MSRGADGRSLLEAPGDRVGTGWRARLGNPGQDRRGASPNGRQRAREDRRRGRGSGGGREDQWRGWRPDPPDRRPDPWGGRASAGLLAAARYAGRGRRARPRGPAAPLGGQASVDGTTAPRRSLESAGRAAGGALGSPGSALPSLPVQAPPAGTRAPVPRGAGTSAPHLLVLPHDERPEAHKQAGSSQPGPQSPCLRPGMGAYRLTLSSCTALSSRRAPSEQTAEAGPARPSVTTVTKWPWTKYGPGQWAGGPPGGTLDAPHPCVCK